jgi:predicted transcriptional regulator
MKAYVKVEYSSGGKSPSEVEKIFVDNGFQKARGTSTFILEVANETELDIKLGELHGALKNSGIMYVPSLGKPTEDMELPLSSAQGRLEKWNEIGANVDELAALLETDVEQFKERALAMATFQIEKIAADREKDLVETEAKRRVEKARDKIVESAMVEGGQTFHQLAGAVGIDEEMLSQMIDDLVEKGKIKAEQKGRRVVYVAS